MKKYLPVLLALTFACYLPVQAQRSCGTMTWLDQYLLNNPGALALYQQDTADGNHQALQFQESGSRATITIPVVVHVVYNTTSQNISDAQVISQITAMNRDYGVTNSDTASTPAIYSALIGHPHLQFCLAHTDPTGQYTTGIERTHTSVTSFIDDDKMKSTTTGGANAWDYKNYLNIWVCNLGSSLLGYATLPNTLPSTGSVDGVVILYQAFGTTGAAQAPFNKGRTVTHEVGHWLNLYHIWGDDGNSCSGSDNVSDTPNQGDENYSCPNFATNTSCSNTGDMSMNYMDYTDDACMYMFTKLQVIRMNSTMANKRLTLQSSTKCNVPADIELNELDVLFSLGPNPSNGTIHLYSGDPTYKTLNVAVYDVTGRQVYFNQFNMGGVNEQIINLGEVRPGIYFVKISDGKNLIVRKIQINK